MAKAGRVIIASNRLPVTVKQNQDGGLDYDLSSGGLVSALKGITTELDYLWFGWPGTDISESQKPFVQHRLRNDWGAVPIFLDRKLARDYGSEFSSKLGIVVRGRST